VSRNRKRAKERRSRRQASTVVRPVASARADRADGIRAEPDGARTDRVDGLRAEPDGVPAEPLHAEPDGPREEELRAEQFDDARVTLGGIDEDGAPSPLGHADPDLELADAQIALGRPADIDQAEVAREQERLDEEIEEQRREREAAVPATAEHRPSLLARVIGFLQGSWRELQRVQWPDRRQVVQATSVVLGFVIVAGVFLGLADLVSSHLMSFILK
jgi:preprotein translocase subunit SecE